MDTIAALEAEGKARRQAAKAARKTPQARERRDRGRKANRRGRDFERTVARYLGGERVIGSGAFGSGKDGDKLTGDVYLGLYRIQCKRTKALTTQRRWLDHDKSDILIQADPHEDINNALVVMRAKTLKAIIEMPETVRKELAE